MTSRALHGGCRALLLVAAGGCATVPLTGRRQLSLVPEADHLGLIFMAMAGYDPHGAETFWKRMAATNKGKAPPEFMSTHPADETRIAAIRQNLPEAMQHYRPAQ